MESVRVMEVIEIMALKGDGTEKDLSLIHI